MELVPGDIQPADKLAQLDRILESRVMHGSDYLKSFLKYVVVKSVETPGASVNEYAIATEVFGRRDDFRARNDSVVRVQASRLRQKLGEYYATEGKRDPVRIELPKGHYHPVFSIVTLTNGVEDVESQPSEVQAQDPSDAAISFSLRNESLRRGLVAVGITGFLLLAAVVLLVIWNVNLRARVAGSGSVSSIAKYGPVWEPFLADDNQTLLVLSNPSVFRFTNPRDPEVLQKNSIVLEPEHANRVNNAIGQKFQIKHGAGSLVLCTDEFTGMGEAIGLARITNLFRSAGRTARIKQSRTISPEDLKNNNVVLLGSVWVNEWSGKLPIKEDFSYTEAATIQNHDPRPGEEREYGPGFDAEGKLIEDYGLITVKPNISYKKLVMIIAGIHSEGTEAAAEFVTNPDYLEVLSERLRQMFGPSSPRRYYQVLLKVAVDNGMPTTISLISVHPLQPEND
jgi:hypothetical protein